MAQSIQEHIKETIRETAARLNNPSINSAEDMIPLMDINKYPHCLLDIPYGNLYSTEKMDIFYPPTVTGDLCSYRLPVFLEVHGGAWYFGQKRSVEFEPFLYGLSRGYVCISLGYTLSPHAHYPTPVLELKSAIRFIRKHACEYGIDPDRIVLWGGSAGAHLAALAATSCDTGYLEEDILRNGAISAKPNVLILWYGCFDYYHHGRYLEDWIYENFFGTTDLNSVKSELALSSPNEHLTEKSCPTLLQHGLSDQIVPNTQSIAYYEKLVSLIGPDKCRLDLFPDCDHADAKLFSLDNIQKIYDFADEMLSTRPLNEST